MSHKVHPKIFRIRTMQDWNSRGFYGRKEPLLLEEDFRIRRFIEKKLKGAGLEKVEIERFPKQVNVIISTSRPGLVIGRRGEEVEKLKEQLSKLLLEKKGLKIEIVTVKNPWLSAKLAGQWIAQRVEKRAPFRRVLKQALSQIMAQKEAKGARVQISGRLGGVRMARTEWLKQGRLPRQTLRSDIDFATTLAYCTYGVIGVKVWIYKGEKL